MNLKQKTSRDYERLYDLVVNHGFSVPCRLDYSFTDSEHVFTDHAVCAKSDHRELDVKIYVRGSTYLNACEFQLKLSDRFKSVKEMFIRDCENNNVEWFDTFELEEE